MGRYTRKERRIGKVAVMEVTQVVGVRTRARTLALAASAAATSAEDAAESAEAAEAAAEVAGVSPKRKKAVPKEVAGELQMAYLQLRSRSLVMKNRRFSKSARNSDVKRCGSVEQGRISRCSSIASCEMVEEDDDFRLPSSGGQKPRQEIGSSVCNYEFDRGDRRDITPPSNPSELDSTAERESRQQRPQSTTMPSAAEIEDFFAAPEKSQKQQFAARYNFDVDNEVPLDGRYDWVRIN